MSYFLIEYTFSSVAGNDAPVSADKITLGCDWAANLLTASSFKVAQYEICNVNSFHVQIHCLKKRMGYVHEDFAVWLILVMVMTLIFQFDVWHELQAIVYFTEMD